MAVPLNPWLAATSAIDREARCYMTKLGFAIAFAFIIAGLAGSIATAPAARVLPAGPDWAFPGEGASAVVAPFPTRIVTLAGSTVRYPEMEIDDGYHAVDWWPATHPPLPRVVRIGRAPNVLACGYCHLPDGQGRPENASLAGLPAEYIVAAVNAIRSGDRPGLRPGWVPIAYMRQTAHAVTATELAAAAAYFAARPYVTHTRLVETAKIPRVIVDAFVYRRDPRGGTEPLGNRIVELPDDFHRFDRRDPTESYTAYVPHGAITRGRNLASGGDVSGLLACETCHAQGLRGGSIGPPLAGRSPTGLFRQLDAFRLGARRGHVDAVMRAEVAHLSEADLVSLAAYAASLPPDGRTRIRM